MPGLGSKTKLHRALKTLWMVLFCAPLVAVIVVACGDPVGKTQSSKPAGKSEPQSDKCLNGAKTRYANPGHAHSAIDLTSEQLTARAAGVYTVLSGAHPHTVELSTADFGKLHAGSFVQKRDRENNGHLIEFFCN